MHGALTFFRRRLEPALAILSDRDVDDDLFRHLLGRLFFTPTTLVTSSAMGVMVTLAAWALTHSALCLPFLLLHVLVGLGRWRLVRAFVRVRNDPLSRAQMVRFDRRFMAWSVLFSAGIGVMCALVTARGAGQGEVGLAMGVTCGFTVAFCQRSGSRLWLVIGQVAAMCLPMILAFALTDQPHAAVFVGLLSALLVVAVILGFAAREQTVALDRADRKTRHMAHTDMLTELMNRYAFSIALEAEIAACQEGESAGFALMLIDLDRFKEINDAHGHVAGDAVLVETASRLRRVAPPAAKIARLGGDEFIIIAPISETCPPVVNAAWALVEALAQPVHIDDIVSPISASLGLVLYPDHGHDPLDLLKMADLALYEGKRQGRNRVCLFDLPLQQRFDENRSCELDMERALACEEFDPWLQPIRNLHTGEIVGYEALARWRRAGVGWEQPAKFVPLAEQSGAIERIGEQILRKACIAAQAWPKPLFVAVNLSPVQFRRPRKLLQMVKEALADSGLPPRRLHLEITESLMIEDTLVARAVLDELADFGVTLSLDDFGAGYSSLSYIQSYRFSKIKIDKSFVDRIETSKESIAIISAVRALATWLKIELIAEGVERPGQDRVLRELGVEFGQGFLYGRPAPGIVEDNAAEQLSA